MTLLTAEEICEANAQFLDEEEEFEGILRTSGLRVATATSSGWPRGLSLSSYMTKYNGRSIDYDGNHSYQCVDNARVWTYNIGGHQLPGLSAGAKYAMDWADTRYWTKVWNSATNHPPVGALVVWNGHVGGGYGHIAIARAGCDVTHLYTFDQNWGHPYCTKVSHSINGSAYRYVRGWLVKR